MPISVDMVPRIEIDRFWNKVYNKPEYFDPDYVIRAYRNLGLEVIPEPCDIALIEKIVRALQDKAPLSVVRIGEGEAKVLSWKAYRGMLNLERYTTTIEVTHHNQDAFHITDGWLSIMREMMMNSILEADMIGCRGISKIVRCISAVDFFERRHDDSNLRGAVGVFRSVDYMLHLAEKGYFRGKIVCSAYLYFGILEFLKELFHYAAKVICITSETQVVEMMRRKYPGNEFIHIEVGKQNIEGINRSSPSFLVEVEQKLQADLKGILCLVGAGIWAESYCTWIKRKGGIGIDIGSGFDILAGKSNRAAHKDFYGETVKAYL